MIIFIFQNQETKENIDSNAISILESNLELYIPFEGLVDMEQERKRLEEEKIEASNNRKNLGIDYTNLEDKVYKVSLTNDDANGLMQVKTAFEMGITETNFYFENGTVVPLKSVDDLLHLGQFVSVERNKFFL